MAEQGNGLAQGPLPRAGAACRSGHKPERAYCQFPAEFICCPFWLNEF